MFTPELLTYIKNQVAAGQNKENIKNILLANGWQEADINAAFVDLENSPSAAAKSTSPEVALGGPISPAASFPEPAMDLKPAAIKPMPEITIGGPAEPSMQAIAPDIEKPAASGMDVAGSAPFEASKPMAFGAEPTLTPEFKKETEKPSSPMEFSTPEMPAQAFEASETQAEKMVLEPAQLKPVSKVGGVLKLIGGVALGFLLGFLVFGMGDVLKRLAGQQPELPSVSPGISPAASSPVPELTSLIDPEFGFKIDYPTVWQINTEPVAVNSTTQNIFQADSGLGSTLVVSLSKSTSTSLTLENAWKKLETAYKSLPGAVVAQPEQVVLNSSTTAYFLDIKSGAAGATSTRSFQLLVVRPETRDYFVAAMTALEPFAAEQEAQFRKLLLSFDLLSE